MRLQVSVYINGLKKRQDNLGIIGAVKNLFFIGDGKASILITDGYRSESRPLDDNFTEVRFHEVDVLILKEKSEKNGMYEITFEMRAIKKRLTNNTL